MTFDLSASREILERTPHVLTSLLSSLSATWIHASESEEKWTPFQVVAHMLQCERVDWPSRLRIIMSKAEQRSFEPFDTTAQFEYAKNKDIDELLAEFGEQRQANLALLQSYGITADQLDRTAQHPKLGTVELRHLLSTWTAHDLAHLTQISRTMARELRTEVGPWLQNLRILRE